MRRAGRAHEGNNALRKDAETDAVPFAPFFGSVCPMIRDDTHVKTAYHRVSFRVILYHVFCNEFYWVYRYDFDIPHQTDTLLIRFRYDYDTTHQTDTFLYEFDTILIRLVNLIHF